MSLATVTERLAKIAVLQRGVHPSFADGVCVMEAVAYVCGEPFSDHPACVCPVITAFMSSWNDDLPDDHERTRLLAPLILRIIGSRSTPAVEQLRADLAFGWFAQHATALAPGMSLATMLAQPWDITLQAAWSAAWVVAWSEARSAAAKISWETAVANAAVADGGGLTVAALQLSALDLVDRMLAL